jgi:hypothetical protein
MAGKAGISLTTGPEDPEKVTGVPPRGQCRAESGRQTLMFQAKEAVRLVLNGVAVGVACGPRLPANPAGLGAPTTAAATSLPTTDRIKTGITSRRHQK